MDQAPLPQITLTSGQDAAMKMVGQLLESEEPAVAVLTGYAGTGKTTLLRVLAQQFGNPLVVTPTGKASIRVKEATGLRSSTIHKWMYRATEDAQTGEPKWTKKPLDLLELPGNGLVVVDEASMVNESLWLDVWSMCSRVGLRVLLVGDKFQLPPVTRKVDGEWSTFSALDLKTPYRADLTEVVRQALESPIIRASMALRQSEEAATDALLDLPDVKPEEVAREFLKLDPASRALIAWKNATRHKLNLDVRGVLQYPQETLVPGEPLLVLQNNYGLDRFNGEVVEFEQWSRAPGSQEAVRDRFKNVSSMVSWGLAGVVGQVAILSPEEVFGKTQGVGEIVLARNGRHYARDTWGYEKETTPPYLNANLGYCLTAHKAQGSEWQDVLVVIEEGRGPSSYDGRRWLYTAMTRARQNIKLSWY